MKEEEEEKEEGEEEEVAEADDVDVGLLTGLFTGCEAPGRRGWV